MKDLYTVLVTILAIGLALMLGATYYKDDIKFKEIDHQIDSLNTVIEQRQSAINLLDKQINSLKDSIAKEDKQIDYYKRRIQELKDKNGKVQPTNNASAADVTDFLSKRYNGK